MSERKYFGTDGVRGTVGEAPITPEFVLRLGQATGRALLQAIGQSSEQRPTVLIGKDTRISGYMLEAALESGLSSAGVDVVLCGPLPTPGVAYLTRALRLDAGIVISASHNPYPDNGIKFFSERGTKLSDAVEERIEAELEQPWRCVEAKLLGKARRLDDAAGRYIEFCKRTFPNEADLKGLRIVVDSAHGAAYHVAPPVFHELGAEVISLGASPDGLNINDGVGAVHPNHLAEAVRNNNADFGIALDGDADRVVIADAKGRMYNGDELLYIIVRDRMLHSKKVDGVVGTLMTNYSLERRFRELGIPFVRAKVGDRYVLEMLEEKKWLYGGEGSGHLLCLDCHTTGDGIVSALQVLSAVRRQDKSLAELTSDLVLMPQALVNARVDRGFEWRAHTALVAAVSDAERELNGSGRVLIRASGTEPVLRVMVEASEAEIAEAMAQRVASALRRAHF
ncbi:MAG TPA: phosphoglucosamine mutase [Burkholderiaceae bacterium]|nr:phosphoglucosamine mutase [Burkholderiaceae bacterium]